MLGRSTHFLGKCDLILRKEEYLIFSIKSHSPRKCVDLPNIYHYIYQHLPTEPYIDVPWQVRDCRISAFWAKLCDLGERSHCLRPHPQSEYSQNTFRVHSEYIQSTFRVYEFTALCVYPVSKNFINLIKVS